MAKAKVSDVLGSWHHLVEGLTGSTKDCYDQMEKAITAREMPGVMISRVTWREGGALSAERLYLRVSRGDICFDICAAPFGPKSFFFSWWLARRAGSGLAPTVLLLVLTLLLAWKTSVLVAAAGLVAAFVVIGFVISRFETRFAADFLAVPFLGWLWRIGFLPVTYYRLDTEAMYRAAVQGAVMEVVDAMTEAKGLRKLTEAERKPVLREFYQR